MYFKRVKASVLHIVFGIAIFCTLGGKQRSFLDHNKNYPVENLDIKLKCYNLKCVCDDGKSLRYSNDRHQIEFTYGGKEILFDGVKIFLARPLCKRLNQRVIASVDFEKILRPLLSPEKMQRCLRAGGCIVIDPGHGGKAEGTKNAQLKLVEKKLTLLSALKLSNALRKLGYTVYLTRNRDVDLSLDQRSQFANRQKAQLFISLHYNSASSKQANGIETFMHSFAFHPSTDRSVVLPTDNVVVNNNRFDMQNTYLGFCLQKALFAHLKMMDRGVRRARFGVLKDVRCPAVLIECGFLSNPNEAKQIATNEYQDKLIAGIVDAIQAYVQAKKESNGLPKVKTRSFLSRCLFKKSQ